MIAQTVPGGPGSDQFWALIIIVVVVVVIIAISMG
jgi:hypothetical protein